MQSIFSHPRIAMKAMQLAAPGGFDHLKLVELPAPPRPPPARSRCAFTPARSTTTTWLVRRPGAAADGRIPMADGAGVVTAVGAGVTEFAVGDAVVSTFFRNGCRAAMCPPTSSSCPATAWTALHANPSPCPPPALPMPPGLEPCRGRHADHGRPHGLARAGGGRRPQAGDTVLVLGTGGVSIFALQMAKSMGATVIATTSSRAKAEQLKALGADW
jgi:NADPH:quinone reductase-like Zn-dependent oxidoreductase